MRHLFPLLVNTEPTTKHYLELLESEFTKKINNIKIASPTKTTVPCYQTYFFKIDPNFQKFLWQTFPCHVCLILSISVTHFHTLIYTSFPTEKVKYFVTWTTCQRRIKETFPGDRLCGVCRCSCPQTRNMQVEFIGDCKIACRCEWPPVSVLYVCLVIDWQPVQSGTMSTESDSSSVTSH